MSDWIRWGVLGNATIARVCVIPALQQARNGVLQALATHRPAEARKTYDDPELQIYDEYADLLVDPQIDAVYIPLPNHLHKAWTIRALAAGKHVLCEKPLALNAAEAREMAAAAAANDRLLLEGFMYRFHPRSRKIRKMVAGNLLGRIRFIDTAFSFQLDADDDDFRLRPEHGGGALLDVGSYGVSVARWLLGEEPESVQAQAIYGPTGVDESIVGTLRFPGGCLAHIEASFSAALQQTFKVVGTEAVIELPHDAFIPWEAPARFRLRCGDETEGHLETVKGTDEYRRMVEHFADAALGRAPLAYSPADSIRNMRVLDGLAAAAREQRVISLDLDENRPATNFTN
jgi:predicted dehydrogenase